ncbi:MAG: tRNA lysidine(34) synthetase TilS, partial [Deltaproteobacteria bacterium]|nr:tRNA lysidine(34) synthetase TilS [Deltaproteobacteria bacterium]
MKKTPQNAVLVNLRLDPFYKKFRAVIKRDSFILEGDSVLAGVSGGVDSMVLADLLVRLREDISFKLNLAHVNYRMRGEESDAQEKLVRDFAKRHSLDCFVTHADLKKTGENFQQAARDFRYDYFAEAAAQAKANKVAVAHHREDQVETILAQLLRGASLRGLGGMRGVRGLRTTDPSTGLRAGYGPRTGDKDRQVRSPLSTVHGPILIRPLLAFSKEALHGYAREHNIPYLEDSSNASPKYWRNRIRMELLPLLEDLRPQALEKLIRFGEEAGEVAQFLEVMGREWLQSYAKKEDGGYWLPRPRLAALPKVLRMEIIAQAYAGLTETLNHLQNDHLSHCDSLTVGE